MVVEVCCRDWRASEDSGLREGRIGILKTVASGWRAGESFMMEWLLLRFSCSERLWSLNLHNFVISSRTSLKVASSLHKFRINSLADESKKSAISPSNRTLQTLLTTKMF